VHIGFYLDEWRNGGIAGLNERIARQLVRQGDTATIFLARAYAKRSESDREGYLRYKRAVGSACVSLDLAAYPPRWREAHFVETVLKRGVECLFVSLFRPQTVALEMLSRHIPVIGISHNDHSYFYDEYIASRSFLTAHIAPSRRIYDRCSQLAGPERRPSVRHIINGVEIPATTGVPPSGPLKVIYCSRLEQIQKRSLDLPAVWKSFLARGGTGTLSVIGCGQVQKNLHEALAAEQAAGSVRFFGHLEEEAVFKEMLTGDVTLSLAHFEAFPQAITEGAARGLWPLLSDIESGHPEIIEMLGYGSLCPIGDTVAFADELLRLSSDLPGLRKKRSALRAQAERFFSLTRCAQAYHDLALEVIGEMQKRPAHPPPKPYAPTLQERAKRVMLNTKSARHSS
jgi:glycosyltransferase involved in cell wall biosynthesis